MDWKDPLDPELSSHIRESDLAHAKQLESNRERLRAALDKLRRGTQTKTKAITLPDPGVTRPGVKPVDPGPIIPGGITLPGVTSVKPVGPGPIIPGGITLPGVKPVDPRLISPTGPRSRAPTPTGLDDNPPSGGG